MMNRRICLPHAYTLLIAASLAGCGGGSSASNDTSATATPTTVGTTSATTSIAASVLPTLQPTPPVIALDLPTKPIPTGGHLPIVSPPNATGKRVVKAGTIAETACFKAMIPYEGVAQGDGCRVAFGTQSLGAGTGMDTPYFEAQVLSDKSPTLDALVNEILGSYAANDAKVEASGSPFERTNLARRGKLGTDKGSYLGSRSSSIFGQPARILTWGFVAQGRKMEYVFVLTMLPRGRYVVSGKPITALLINGYTSGYQSKLFTFALSHFEML